MATQRAAAVLVVRFLLMMFLTNFVHSQTTEEPQACQLYSVTSQSVLNWTLVKGRTDYLTLVPDLREVNMKVTVKIEDTCLVGYEDGCSFTSSADKVAGMVTVAVLLTEDGKWKVWEKSEGGGAGREKKCVTNPSSLKTTVATITGSFVSVAFSCPNGCLRFRDAIISKNLATKNRGSLAVYGKFSTNNSKQIGSVRLWYGGVWSLDMNRRQFNTENWTKVNVTATYNDDRTCYGQFKMTGTYTIGDRTPLNLFSANKPYQCIFSQSIVLKFSQSGDMEWSLCLPPVHSSTTTVDGYDVTTTAFSLTSNNASPLINNNNNNNNNTDYSTPTMVFGSILTLKRKVSLILLGVIILGLTVTYLSAYVIISCRRRRWDAATHVVTVNAHYSVNRKEEDHNDNPENHIYEEIEKYIPHSSSRVTPGAPEVDHLATASREEKREEEKKEKDLEKEEKQQEVVGGRP